MEFSSYITGFVDGEGSFCVSFNKRNSLHVGIEVRPSFSVSQHKRSKEILHKFHAYFGCGSIRYSARDQNYKYEVRSLNDLTQIIIPHFQQYQLQTSKRDDFGLFSTICFKMAEKEHHTARGIESIIDLAYQMNNLGSRRYSKTEILRLHTR